MNHTINKNLKKQIAAIVLAAGQSTRFGAKNKLLTYLSGEPLIVRTLRCVQAFGVGHVVVVTGHEDNLVRDAMASFTISTTHNEHFQAGMGTSIAAGIRACLDTTQAAAICLGDMPNISSATFEKMVRHLSSVNDIKKAIVVPRQNNRRGHPVLFGSHYFSALSGLSGDKGAHDIIHKNKDRLLEIDVDDPGIHQDFDITSDFKHKA